MAREETREETKCIHPLPEASYEQNCKEPSTSSSSILLLASRRIHSMYCFIIHHGTCIMPTRNTSTSNSKCKLQAELQRTQIPFLSPMSSINAENKMQPQSQYVLVNAPNASCETKRRIKVTSIFHSFPVTTHLSDSPHAPPDNTSQTPSYAPTPQTSPPSTRKYISTQA